MFQGLVFGKSFLMSSHAGLDIIMGCVKSFTMVPVEDFHC